jgi:hypothetical protein
VFHFPLSHQRGNESNAACTSYHLILSRAKSSSKILVSAAKRLLMSRALLCPAPRTTMRPGEALGRRRAELWQIRRPVFHDRHGLELIVRWRFDASLVGCFWHFEDQNPVEGNVCCRGLKRTLRLTPTRLDYRSLPIDVFERPSFMHASGTRSALARLKSCVGRRVLRQPGEKELVAEGQDDGAYKQADNPRVEKTANGSHKDD